MKMLLCCTGNTCRSFMAEYMLKELLSKRGLNRQITVFSRGLDVTLREPTREAVRALGEMGIKTGNHRPTQLTGKDVKAADLILTMTSSHKKTLLSGHPEGKNKTFTLMEFANGGSNESDVADPFGSDTIQYRKCAKEILKGLEKVVERILLDNGKSKGSHL